VASAAVKDGRVDGGSSIRDRRWRDGTLGIWLRDADDDVHVDDVDDREADDDVHTGFVHVDHVLAAASRKSGPSPGR
jgi:hypothetical protein